MMMILDQESAREDGTKWIVLRPILEVESIELGLNMSPFLAQEMGGWA